jgi:hypothetical protein
MFHACDCVICCAQTKKVCDIGVDEPTMFIQNHSYFEKSCHALNGYKYQSWN